MHDEYQAIDDGQEDAGQSRREFLKTAGKVAWVVPTLQVVNMAAAAAGEVEGSVVTTSPPTTGPPDCRIYKVTAVYRCEDNGNVGREGDQCEKGYWEWSGNVTDCINPGSYDAHKNGGDLGIKIADGSNMYGIKVYHDNKDCWFIAAEGFWAAEETCIVGGYEQFAAYVELPPADNGRGGLRTAEFLIACGKCE